ncbi:hypothetical protein AVEN_201853-1 [Araneus ventricosus]|uniref:DUF4371 domain-containing protein n=1 Tax=Araneus ventricosus TaxID=182803 RepID=A0A4Y2KQ30_ARAVE|nr:hypothetical protein AVEN_201853-1 [Araneus ventricosus]
MKSSKHMSNVKAKKDNLALPGASQTAAQEKSSSTYGLHPMLSSAEISTETRIPRSLILSIDRVVNSDAMFLSFLAEKSLTFSLALDLQFIRRMSHDKKALNCITMHHTSASYKLRFGVSKIIKENVVEDFKKGKFSLNIDNSTSNSNEKVVTVLANYLKSEKIVTEHLQSFSVDCANSASLFMGFVSLIDENAIPFIICYLCYWTCVAS